VREAAINKDGYQYNPVDQNRFGLDGKTETDPFYMN
jgi:hypothetical protein